MTGTKGTSGAGGAGALALARRAGALLWRPVVVGTLPPGRRAAAVVGLVVLAVAVPVFLLTWWSDGERTGGGHALPAWVRATAVTVAPVAVLVGLALLALATAEPGARWGRWLHAGVHVTLALVVTQTSIDLTAATPGWAGLVPMAAVTFTVMVTADRVADVRAGRLPPPGRAPVPALLALGTVAAAVVVAGVTRGPDGALAVASTSLLVVNGLMFVVPVVLLLWLAVIGLRTSRDAAAALVRRTSARGDAAAAVLATGLAALVVVVVLVHGVLHEPWRRVLPGPGHLLVAVPFVALTLGVLAREHRMQLQERTHDDAALWLAALAGVAAAPLSVLFVGFLLVLLPAVVASGVAVVTALVTVAVRRRWWPGAGRARAAAYALVALAAATCGPLLRGPGGRRRALYDGVGVIRGLTPVIRYEAVLLVTALLVGVAGGLVLLHRRRHENRALHTVVHLTLAWVAGTVLLVVLRVAGVPVPTLRPPAFHVVLLLGLLGCLVAWRRGLQRVVDPVEVVLVAVVCSVVVLAPPLKDVLAALVGPDVAFLLGGVALVVPVVLQLTFDTEQLNAERPERARAVVGVVGLCCAVVGGLLSTVAGAGTRLASPGWADLLASLVLVPSAVMLVAGTSARLRAEGVGPAATGRPLEPVVDLS